MSITNLPFLRSIIQEWSNAHFGRVLPDNERGGILYPQGGSVRYLSYNPKVASSEREVDHDAGMADLKAKNLSAVNSRIGISHTHPPSREHLATIEMPSLQDYILIKTPPPSQVLQNLKKLLLPPPPATTPTKKRTELAPSIRKELPCAIRRGDARDIMKEIMRVLDSMRPRPRGSGSSVPGLKNALLDNPGLQKKILEKLTNKKPRDMGGDPTEELSPKKARLDPTGRGPSIKDLTRRKRPLSKKPKQQETENWWEEHDYVPTSDPDPSFPHPTFILHESVPRYEPRELDPDPGGGGGDEKPSKAPPPPDDDNGGGGGDPDEKPKGKPKGKPKEKPKGGGSAPPKKPSGSKGEDPLSFPPEDQVTYDFNIWEDKGESGGGYTPNKHREVILKDPLSGMRTLSPHMDDQDPHKIDDGDEYERGLARLLSQSDEIKRQDPDSPSGLSSGPSFEGLFGSTLAPRIRTSPYVDDDAAPVDEEEAYRILDELLFSGDTISYYGPDGKPRSRVRPLTMEDMPDVISPRARTANLSKAASRGQASPQRQTLQASSPKPKAQRLDILAPSNPDA